MNNSIFQPTHEADVRAHGRRSQAAPPPADWAQREWSRSHLYPSAKVTRLADPEFEREYRLVEISGTALQLAADESLPPDERICIEVQHYLLLADVKHCVRRGNKFAIDAARIVTIRKTVALGGAPSSAKIDALMADLHLQCQMRLSTIEATIANLDVRMGIEPNPRPNSAQEQFPSCIDEAPPVPAHSGDPSPASASLSDFGWPPAPCVVTLVGMEALESAATKEPDTHLSHVTADVLAVGSPHEPTGNLATFEELARKTEPGSAETLRVPGRLEGRAGPVRTFAEHMSLAGVSPRRRGIRRWAILAGSAATLAILAWAMLLFGLSRKGAPRVAAEEPKAPAVLSASRTKPPAPKAAPPAPAIPAPSQAQSSRPAVKEVTPSAIRQAPRGVAILRASIKANGASWVSVCSDGRELFQNMLASGDTREVEFSNVALVRLGNVPVVDIEVNGKSIQPLGPPGVVRAIELSSGGARFLLVNSPEVARACGSDLSTVYPNEATVASR